MYVKKQRKNEKALASTLLLPLPLKVGHKSQTKIHTKKTNLERKKKKKRVNKRGNREGVKKHPTTEGGLVVVYVAVVKEGRRNKQKAITG